MRVNFLISFILASRITDPDILESQLRYLFNQIFKRCFIIIYKDIKYIKKRTYTQKNMYNLCNYEKTNQGEILLQHATAQQTFVQYECNSITKIIITHFQKHNYVVNHAYK